MGLVPSVPTPIPTISGAAYQHIASASLLPAMPQCYRREGSWATK